MASKKVILLVLVAAFAVVALITWELWSFARRAFGAPSPVPGSGGSNWGGGSSGGHGATGTW